MQRLYSEILFFSILLCLPVALLVAEGGQDPQTGETALFPLPVKASAPALPLDEIKYWAYVIQDVSRNMDELERSRYEMLVIEPMRTDHSDTLSRGFNTASAVKRLKESAGNDGSHRKMVIAYIDIGQAEDWRWYWRWSVHSHWDPEEGEKPEDWPEWILAHDPEWVGNFPVAYWHKDWRDIVINGSFRWKDERVEVPGGSAYGGEGYDSILDEVIKDGFDGIYLDWVEAFSDESVAEAAAESGIDPEEAMFDFIEAMRDYGRRRFEEMGREPDEWIIIQQNAPDLADSDDPRRFSLIDGIAEEGVWREGLGDAEWDDKSGYDSSARRKLGRGWYDSVLERWLPMYQDAGIPVFACEYALEYADEIYRILAPEAEFVPYCTRRSLSRLTTTPPYFD